MGDLCLRISALILTTIFVACGAVSARAEELASAPGWSLNRIVQEKADNDFSYGESRVFFALKPPDQRPAVTIDSRAADRLRSGEATAESLYGGQAPRPSQNKDEEFVYGNKSNGLVVAEPVLSTLTAADGRSDAAFEVPVAESSRSSSSSSSSGSSLGELSSGSSSSSRAFGGPSEAPPSHNASAASAPPPVAGPPAGGGDRAVVDARVIANEQAKILAPVVPATTTGMSAKNEAGGFGIKPKDMDGKEQKDKKSFEIVWPNGDPTKEGYKEPPAKKTPEAADGATSCEKLEFNFCKKLVRSYDDTRFENVPKSFALYRSACQKNDGFACAILGFYAKRRVANDKDLVNEKMDANMIEALEHGCEIRRNRHDCYAAGVVYWEGIGVAASDSHALAYFSLGCQQVHANSCVAAAMFVGEGWGGATKDNAKAMSLLNPYCRGGSYEGCFGIGFIHMGGYGGDVNEELSHTFFKKACDSGDGHACSAVGFTFENGRGAEKSLSKAAEFYEKGCKLNHPDGCTNRARLYGKQSTPDLKKAQGQYEKGCELGSAAACGELASLLLALNENIMSEPVINYLDLACDRHDVQSCSDLSSIYEKGDGVPASASKSKEYAEKARKARVGSVIKGM